MADGPNDGDDTATTTRDRVLIAVVPIVLIAVALVSIVRYHDLRQSSWQGIGFGMFATYDTSVSRMVRTEIEVDGDTRLVDAATAFPDLVDRAKTIPLGGDPEELARRVRQRTGADRVVVEVWDPDVRRGDGRIEITLDPIRRVEVP